MRVQKIAALAVLSALASTPAAYADPADKAYTIKPWPSSIENAPCEVWQKQSDGTWLLVKTVTDKRGRAYNDQAYRGDDQAAGPDRRCSGQN